ncbi:MAG: cysteine desulfurase [Bacteroidota bacterium]|nr:cysteine desulfurase [Candidatus Kapabacteria bacterium]MDW8074612.1 cysteine desulfurase [Bacteroidota bacterium]
MLTNLHSIPQTEFDVELIRADFPILQQRPYGKPLVYLDNAATTQKPHCVIETITQYYQTTNSNVHRGIHFLSEKATDAYEHAREIVRRFIGAQQIEEIVFTRGTTESINLVASSWGAANLQPGDEILLTVFEHHSNIVPWQLIAERTGARLQVAPLEEDGTFDIERLLERITERTRLVAVAHVSNVLGIVLPIEPIVERAHAVGAVVLVDGAQAVAHLAVNVAQLDCDFYAFSGHKIYGPTGIGVLYGKRALLESMPPYQGGGDMIRRVTFEKTTYNDLPYKFEAGTPPIAEAIGLARALEYVSTIGLNTIAAWEEQLVSRCVELLSQIDDVRLLGPKQGRTGVVSFVVDGVHPHDIATFLDRQGIALRAGHHCAQPLMDFFGVPASARFSVAMYNTLEEIEYAISALDECLNFLR